MATGKVKWFNNQKKYGFIFIDGREVFVHFSAILKEGYKTLKKGQEVECDVVSSPNGERAINVREKPQAAPSSHAHGGKGSSFSSGGHPIKHVKPY